MLALGMAIVLSGCSMPIKSILPTYTKEDDEKALHAPYKHQYKESE
jgi:hypothetical protein